MISRESNVEVQFFPQTPVLCILGEALMRLNLFPASPFVLSLIVGAVLVGCGGAETPTPSTPAAKDGSPKTPVNGEKPKGEVVPALREGWPTEAEAIAAIFKVEYAIRASDTNKAVWKVKDMKHEVKSVKFALKTIEKQMNFGASAITVYPAKIIYTRITEYEHKAATRDEEGANGVWFFYRDSFGEWTAKYGSE